MMSTCSECQSTAMHPSRESARCTRVLATVDLSPEAGWARQNRGEAVVVLDRVRFGLWAITDSGIIFTTIERKQDVLDFYGFRDRLVRRLGVRRFAFLESPALVG